MIAALSIVALMQGAGARGAGATAAFVQQGAKLTASGESGAADFGYSVALSANGDTALIGAPRDDHALGAAWVFTRVGSNWRQQAKLTPRGASGHAGFGWSVALSANGDTALVGGIGDHGNLGAAWVFTRSGSAWTQDSAKLTGPGESGEGAFGWSVALSGNGRTALVGAPDDGRETGAVWFFSRTSAGWKAQGRKLIGTGFGAQLGSSVALSGNGKTALIGSDGAGNEAGAVWALARSAAAADLPATELKGGGETAGYGRFGWTVALSATGSSAVVGSYNPYEAVWGFAHSGSGWKQQGGKFTGSGEAGYGGFGASVGLSGDGKTAIVGGNRAGWVYTRTPSGWSAHRTKLSGTDQVAGGTFAGGRFGYAVAISADGGTILVGGPGDAKARGAVWVFAR